jgi:hypothetical protein
MASEDQPQSYDDEEDEGLGEDDDDDDDDDDPGYMDMIDSCSNRNRQQQRPVNHDIINMHVADSTNPRDYNDLLWDIGR